MVENELRMLVEILEKYRGQSHRAVRPDDWLNYEWLSKSVVRAMLIVARRETHSTQIVRAAIVGVRVMLLQHMETHLRTSWLRSLRSRVFRCGERFWIFYTTKRMVRGLLSEPFGLGLGVQSVNSVGAKTTTEVSKELCALKSSIESMRGHQRRPVVRSGDCTAGCDIRFLFEHEGFKLTKAEIQRGYELKDTTAKTYVRRCLDRHGPDESTMNPTDEPDEPRSARDGLDPEDEEWVESLLNVNELQREWNEIQRVPKSAEDTAGHPPEKPLALAWLWFTQVLRPQWMIPCVTIFLCIVGYGVLPKPTRLQSLGGGKGPVANSLPRNLEINRLRTWVRLYEREDYLEGPLIESETGQGASGFMASLRGRDDAGHAGFFQGFLWLSNSQPPAVTLIGDFWTAGGVTNSVRQVFDTAP